MASDSSSDSDDNLAKLKSAVDPDFQLVPSSVCITHSSNGIGSSNLNSGPTQVVIQQPIKKSNRMILSTEWEAGHFVHPLKLTTHSQEFVSKQLFEALDSQIKGVKRTIIQHEEEDDGIFLFHSSTRRLSGKDLKRSTRKLAKAQKVQKKPKIEKRKVDVDSSSDEDSKLQSVAVSVDWVLNPTSV